MGSLISRIARKSSRRNSETKLIIVGLDGAGKTTVLYKLKLGDITTTVPTIGFNVETVKYKNVLFKVWDIGGQENTRCLWQHYYHDTKGIIFVIDSSDVQRIDDDYNDYNFGFANKCNCSYSNCSSNEISNHNNAYTPSCRTHYHNKHCAHDELKQMLSHPSLNECPLLILANKQDLSNAMSLQEIRERLGLDTITNHKWYLQPTCAMTGEGVMQGLTWLSKNCSKH